MTVISLLLANFTFADILLPRIFTNSMVLQAGKKVSIWGRSDANAQVRIEFANQKIITKADEDGRWQIFLNPMKPSKEPRTMKVLEDGKVKKVIDNVLIGEVWVVAGESNMTYALRGMQNSQKIIKNANNSMIRYFNQGGTPYTRTTTGIGSKPEFDTPRGTGWLVCSPKNAEYSFKAIAYLFAKDLAHNLNIPIGIIYTPIASSRMISWIDRDTFEHHTAFQRARKLYQQRLEQYDYDSSLKIFETNLNDYKQTLPLAKQQGKQTTSKKLVGEWMRPWKDSPDGWATPAMLYNLRIHPIKELTVAGIIWSQSTPEYLDYKNYYNMFDAFISLWRKTFNENQLPFVFLQLPSNDDKLSPSIRVQQQLLSEVVKNTYMIESIDTTIKTTDLQNDNYLLASRYSNTVLSNIYNKTHVNTIPPVVGKIIFDKNIATVLIKNVQNLNCKGKIRGFEALVDGEWVVANATILENKITVSIDESKTLDGVRYLFYPDTKPDVCLYNENNIPLSPFIKRVKPNAP